MPTLPMTYGVLPALDKAAIAWDWKQKNPGQSPSEEALRTYGGQAIAESRVGDMAAAYNTHLDRVWEPHRDLMRFEDRPHPVSAVDLKSDLFDSFKRESARLVQAHMATTSKFGIEKDVEKRRAETRIEYEMLEDPENIRRLYEAHKAALAKAAAEPPQPPKGSKSKKPSKGSQPPGGMTAPAAATAEIPEGSAAAGVIAAIIEAGPKNLSDTQPDAQSTTPGLP